ncbi:MAG: tetratricopeptide repeat protein [Cyclobacteriaceae bacterium]|nr:tetratricopeptide repeat protein [Cyclobacteriaceae bacterium]MCH8516098.1 tetratricopeptide repeat protein [Cyclobacteriaceae bacterium]
MKLGFKSIFILFILLGVFYTPASHAQFLKKNKKESKKNEGDEPKELSNKDRVQAEYFFIDGIKYALLEEWAKALVLFNKSIELNPGVATPHLKVSEILQEQGDLEKALYHANEAIRLNDQNPAYYEQAAKVHTEMGNLKEASEVYERMFAKIDKDLKEYYFNLAALYMYQQEFERAINIYDKIEEEFGLNEDLVIQKQKIYLRLNDLEGAIKETQKLVKSNPQSEQYMLSMAELLNANKKSKEAIELVESFVRENKDAVRSKFYLSKIYAEQRKYDLSDSLMLEVLPSDMLSLQDKLNYFVSRFSRRSDFSDEEKLRLKKIGEAILTNHEEESRAHAAMGDLYFALKDKSSALENYLNSLVLDDTNFNVWNNVLTLQYETQDFDELAKYADQALILYPNHAPFYLYLGVAHFSNQNYQRAVRAFEQGKKLSSSNLQLLGYFLSHLGDSYYRLNEFEKSDEAYEAVLDFEPDNMYVLNNYSYYLSLRKEKLDKAKEMSGKTVQKEPHNPTYLDTYAWVLFQMGEYEKAKKYIERAIEKGETSGEVYEHYGDILYKNGDVDKAVTYWEKARGLDDASELIDKKIADRKFYE